MSLRFASKYVVEAESESESLSEEDYCYSDEEYSGSGSDGEVDAKELEKEKKTLAAKKEKVRKADTNVVCLSLETLAQQAQLLTGDPIFCKSCGALFNYTSKLTKTDGDEQQKWICEFCATPNDVQIEEEELPKAESGDYILEVPSQQEEKKPAAENLIIFCIDISGSMCVTSEVAGNYKLKGHERLDKLKSLNEDRSNQYLPKQNKNTTWVSRLQCVQAAVENYMTKLLAESPNSLVGVVTFNNDVTIIGDGSTSPVTVTGDKLSQFDTLLDIGRQCAIRRTIKDSHDGLSKHLFALEETGATALGPALLVSLGIASSHVGAQVIICTDGLANVGLGSQDELKNDEQKEAVAQFYTNLGSLAATKGTAISVISIKGTEAKMENLGKLADGSGGQVNIVDPLSLHKEFASILSEPIIATNVAVDFFLHKGLHFRNEEEEEAKNQVLQPKPETETLSKKDLAKKRRKEKKEQKDKEKREKKERNRLEKQKKKKKPRTEKQQAEAQSAVIDDTTNAEGEKEKPEEPKEAPQAKEPKKQVATRQLGNITKEAQVTFEFGIDKDFKTELPELPFQVQIRFTTLDGTKCIRSITRAQPVTKDRSLAEKEADLEVLGLNIAQQSAKMAFKGEYTQARLNAYANKKLLKRAKKNDDDEAYYKGWKSNLNKMERKLQTAQIKEKHHGLNLSDSDSDDERKKERPKADKKKKARSANRSDSTATFLYQMKTPNNKIFTSAKKEK